MCDPRTITVTVDKQPYEVCYSYEGEPNDGLLIELEYVKVSGTVANLMPALDRDAPWALEEIRDACYRDAEKDWWDCFVSAVEGRADEASETLREVNARRGF